MEIWLPRYCCLSLGRSCSKFTGAEVTACLPSLLAEENQISPVVAADELGTKPMTARAVTDFPDPDSPTIPRVCPRFTSKEMPSTALTSTGDSPGPAD
ncbi:hypothetical protein OSCI_2420016 [Kamptonema sp. PCC 6506]|nr:hypothetical protein OSCI_2420016 [Kamptonema sp. PCC 6506]